MAAERAGAIDVDAFESIGLKTKNETSEEKLIEKDKETIEKNP